MPTTISRTTLPGGIIATSRTRTTRTSTLSPAGQGCICLLVILGFIGMLSWNEYRMVTELTALNEGKKVIEVVQNSQEVRSDLDLKLIHFSGTATTNSQIYDNIFGIDNGSENDLKIRRNVHMYQWEETFKGVDDFKEAVYNKQWKPHLVSSSDFWYPDGHENPSSMLYNNEDFVASDIMVGAIPLSDAVLSRMNWYTPFPETLSVNSILDATAKSTATVPEGTNVFYFGTGAPNSPQLGDTMVDFQIFPSQTISVVAMQTEGGLSTYTGKSGATFLLVQSGTVDAMTMFENSYRYHTASAWPLRLAGFMGIWCILCLFAGVIPFVRNLPGMWAILISGFLSFVVTGIIVGLAWLGFRPILSGTVMSFSLGAIAALVLLFEGWGKK